MARSGVNIQWSLRRRQLRRERERQRRRRFPHLIKVGASTPLKLCLQSFAFMQPEWCLVDSEFLHAWRCSLPADMKTSEMLTYDVRNNANTRSSFEVS